MGKMKQKPAFAAMFSKSRGINVLSLARFFLFGARDVWFVVALPVFLEMTMDWNFWQVGGFMGLWVVGYGLVFAMNSSIHSYMVLAYTKAEDVSLNVGFYYMANAGSRLLGTVLSGLVFQLAGGSTGGMVACLWGSALLVGLSYVASVWLPRPRPSLA